jgi:D-alanyl-D-alanine dipeptidase
MATDARLVEISWQEHRILVDLAYAGAGNLAHRPIYANQCCLVRPETEAALRRAAFQADLCGLRLKVLDGFRPQEAQEQLWALLPNKKYLADPASGSNHSRGVAVDLTLVGEDGQDLDMGTAFDTMADASRHLAPGLPPEVHRNRFLLLGIMRSAGFLELEDEWWHYELPDARSYPVLQDDRIQCRDLSPRSVKR